MRKIFVPIALALAFLFSVSFYISKNSDPSHTTTIEKPEIYFFSSAKAQEAGTHVSPDLPPASSEDVLTAASNLLVGVTGKTLKGIALALAITKLLLFLILSPIGKGVLPFLESKGWQMGVSYGLAAIVSLLTFKVQGETWVASILNGAVVAFASEAIYQFSKKVKAATA